ncbi:ABC-type multidrug transport system, ATPase and permease component [Synechococcus sp. PCC 7502]|uniref:ABC transporter ATP-binding protein n=2 Tax=Synechococcus sp. PCC 7502 TaxID=1173263 RepID=UPI00029FDC34|nr:ABC transporter ATP-binding protein [Synechococcus sp. PCC 7502]AFY74908.1 ABC-type multidrug transport system, ATPase and permease component [Synechococcus sp. PCC 7502]
MAKMLDILNYFRAYRGAAIFSITASSLFEVIDLIVPYTIGQILNVLSEQPPDQLIQNMVVTASTVTGLIEDKPLALGVLLGIIFVVSVLRAPIQPWIGAWFHWGIALRARRDGSQKALAKVLTLPLEFYDENNPGRIAGRVARGISNLTWTYPEIAGQMIPKLCRVLGIFVMILLIDWQIAIFFLISFLFILNFSFRNLKRLTDKEKILDKHQENTESRTSEIITNIKTVKAFASEASEMKRQSDRLDRELKVVLYDIHLGYVRLGTQQRTFVQSCVFLVLALSLIATVQGQISIGHFITTLTVSSMAYSELEPISNLGEVFARRYASMLRFHEFMHLPVGRESDSIGIAGIDRAKTYNFTGKVEFSNISFSYDPKNPVLQNIQLLIEPYQTVALVGRSGSGKSTLVKLLFRYFEPSHGRILMDGEDIRNLNISGYRKRLAIVHQEVDVFNGSLYENLIYGNRNANSEQIEAACRIAKVDEFIRLLPQGYNTIVGERGVRMSGGQRQRLGIARALLVEPDVLIFDEATSSLDYESERAIQLAMSQLQGTRTMIIIAHRLSTVREADKIVVLDQGKIAEVGSHQALLAQNGIYHRLHSLQESPSFI